MRSSVQAGPPSAASALSRIRACISFLAAALPAAIRLVEFLAFLGGQGDLVLLHGFLPKRRPLQENRRDPVPQVKSDGLLERFTHGSHTE